MNICLRGHELLMDLKRSDFLPAYDEEGVRVVLSEMSELHSKLDDLVNRYPDITDRIEDLHESVKVTLIYYTGCMNRNNRYLNSYLTHRMAKIRSLPWSTGAVLPEKLRQDTLSARENDYFSAYSKCLSDYCEDIDVDLVSDMEPPKELLIGIRVLVPPGEIMTDNGPVNLSAVGDTLFLRRTDVEHLIRQGQLEHVQFEGANV